MGLRWAWDERKNRTNKRDHKLSFEVAQEVFRDPLALYLCDPHPHEERWKTVGLVGQTVVLVVHTRPSYDSKTGEEVGRIISARRATAHERRAYEEGRF